MSASWEPRLLAQHAVHSCVAASPPEHEVIAVASDLNGPSDCEVKCKLSTESRAALTGASVPQGGEGRTGARAPG